MHSNTDVLKSPEVLNDRVQIKATTVNTLERGKYTTIEYVIDGKKVQIEHFNGEYAVPGDVDFDKSRLDALRSGTMVMTIVNGRPRYYANLGNHGVKESLMNGKPFDSNNSDETKDISIIVSLKNQDGNKESFDARNPWNILESGTQVSAELRVQRLLSYVKIEDGNIEYIISDDEDNKETRDKLKEAIKLAIESGRLGIIQNGYALPGAPVISEDTRIDSGPYKYILPSIPNSQAYRVNPSTMRKMIVVNMADTRLSSE
jgi:hypothetical protein